MANGKTFPQNEILEKIINRMAIFYIHHQPSLESERALELKKFHHKDLNSIRKQKKNCQHSNFFFKCVFFMQWNEKIIPINPNDISLMPEVYWAFCWLRFSLLTFFKSHQNHWCELFFCFLLPARLSQSLTLLPSYVYSNWYFLKIMLSFHYVALIL